MIFYFSQSLESCSSASSEAILNFSKYLESPVHALFTIYYEKFSFNQVFRTKKPCSFAYIADFRRFSPVSVYVTQILVVAIAAFPSPPAAPAPCPNLSLNRSSLTAVGRFAYKLVGNSAHML
jgi:hypothetical protein